MPRRLLSLVLASAALVLLGAGTAFAANGDNPPNWCFRMNADGDMPTCTYMNGHWTRSYDSGFDSGFGGGGGIPSGFVAFAVLAVIIGVGIGIWRISLARKLAQQSGMDPNTATAVTLLSDEGLDATYLASSLRGQQVTQPPVAPPATRSSEDRLRELQTLRDQGLVTSEEYDARRKAIVDSL
jgi:hypothetical protein